MHLLKACKELLITNPFYGLFLLNLQKEIVQPNHPISTLAVAADGISCTLYINSHFWNTLSDREQLACLTHEILHICFFHLTDNFRADSHYNMGIATDCEINQYIAGLPDYVWTVEKLSKELGKKLKNKQGSWYYYNEISEFIQKNPNKCISGNIVSNNTKDIDDHSLWGDFKSEAERKLFENQIKFKLKEVVEACNACAGSIPREMVDIISKIKNNPPIFNWKKYFRRVVANSISNDIQLTRLRPSKRIPGSKGVRIKRKPNICVVIDTSGSICLDNFKEFISEINYMYALGINITIVECDSRITLIFKYSPQKTIEFKGRGGTDMTEALNYYNNTPEFSSCILFTDGYLSTFDLPSCKNLIWVITNDGNKSYDYPGQTIFIP